MSPNNADGMANSVEPDQTAPLGAVWSGSALFAQAYLSKNLGSLRYINMSRRWKQNANSVDTDQTAPSEEVVWSGSTLFSQTSLSYDMSLVTRKPVFGVCD